MDLHSKTRHVDPMLDYCWPSVVDGGPTLVEHWVNKLCFMGIYANGDDM